MALVVGPMSLLRCCFLTNVEGVTARSTGAPGSKGQKVGQSWSGELCSEPASLICVSYMEKIHALLCREMLSVCPWCSHVGLP